MNGGDIIESEGNSCDIVNLPVASVLGCHYLCGHTLHCKVLVEGRGSSAN